MQDCQILLDVCHSHATPSDFVLDVCHILAFGQFSYDLDKVKC